MAATTAELEDSLEQLHGLECAVRAEFLSTVSAIAESDSWRDDGARDLGEWLAGRFPFSPSYARELARVADALRSLPHIAEAFASGELSWDQLRVLTRYATAENDAELAEESKGLSLRGIEAKARRLRRKTAAAERRDLDARSLTMYRVAGVLRLRGDLTGEPSVVIEKAINRALEQQPRPPEGEPAPPFDQRLADALHEVCSGFVAADPDADRATVVLHTEIDVLASDDLVGDLEGLRQALRACRRVSIRPRLAEVRCSRTRWSAHLRL